MIILLETSIGPMSNSGRTIGHESVETTQVYTHVMVKPGLGVRSPLDR